MNTSFSVLWTYEWHLCLPLIMQIKSQLIHSDNSSIVPSGTLLIISGWLLGKECSRILPLFTLLPRRDFRTKHIKCHRRRKNSACSKFQRAVLKQNVNSFKFFSSECLASCRSTPTVICAKYKHIFRVRE